MFATHWGLWRSVREEVSLLQPIAGKPRNKLGVTYRSTSWNSSIHERRWNMSVSTALHETWLDKIICLISSRLLSDYQTQSRVFSLKLKSFIVIFSCIIFRSKTWANLNIILNFKAKYNAIIQTVLLTSLKELNKISLTFDYIKKNNF